MALGMTMAMLLGRGVDMSLGAIVSISSCFAAGFFLQSRGWESILLGILVGIAIGALAGVVNGVLISYLHLPAMLVTYGVREILRGVAYAYMNGGVITSIHPAIRFIGSGRIFGVIPTQIVIALLFTLLAVFLLKCTRMGRELYITGANPAAARFSGIKVDKNIIIGFVCSGVMAAIAGIIYVGRLGAAEAEIGHRLPLPGHQRGCHRWYLVQRRRRQPLGRRDRRVILTLLNTPRTCCKSRPPGRALSTAPPLSSQFCWISLSEASRQNKNKKQRKGEHHDEKDYCYPVGPGHGIRLGCLLVWNHRVRAEIRRPAIHRRRFCPHGRSRFQ